MSRGMGWRWRRVGIAGVLGVWGGCLGLGAYPPMPDFFLSEADFLAWIQEGTFDPHLELHLVSHAMPAPWAMDAAARRGTANLIAGAFGSTASWHLASDALFALNAQLLPALQVRYERRIYDDRRFTLDDERVSALWFPGARWAVVATGWPAADKAEARLGLGVRLGGPGPGNSLEVLGVEERPLWNEKTRGASRYERPARRLVAHGFFGREAWRLRGSLDLGTPFRLVEPAETPDGGQRSLEGCQRLGEVALEVRRPGWTLEALLWMATLARAQREADGRTLELSRGYARMLGSLEVDRGVWIGSACLGWAGQSETFASPSAQDGAYRMSTLILGVEAGRRSGQSLEWRLGYLGAPRRMARTGTELGSAWTDPLERTSDGYADKLSLRCRWVPAPSVRVEGLLSHTVTGASFGGAALKALFQF